MNFFSLKRTLQNSAGASKNVIICPATVTDKSELQSLYRENLLFHYTLDPTYYHHPDAIAHRIEGYVEESFQNNEPTHFIAKDFEGRGESLGFVACAIDPAPYFDMAIEQYGSIYEIFVREHLRGFNLGKLLIDAAEEFLISNGCKHIQLQTSTKNINALEFYKKRGFVESQRVLFKTLPSG